ncbi:unnamed protein product, partial [Hapterophycus canaliculatus]
RRRQPSCQCRNPGVVGMSDLDTLLEFLRQLGLVVEVRLRLLSVWRRVLPCRHRDRDLSNMSEAVEQARRRTIALNQAYVGPLARTIGNELQVLKFTVAAMNLQDGESPVQLQDSVFSHLELRNAIRAWEGGHRGQVGSLLIASVPPPPMHRSTAFSLSSLLQRISSFKSPVVFTYADGPLSHEAYASGINGLEGKTSQFAFSFALPEL